MHHGHISKMLALVMALLVLAIVAAGIGMARAETITVSSNMCVNLTSDLARGSKGTEVTQLQDFLAGESLFSAKPTGFFGPVTEAALKKYQASRHIPQTGKADAVTRSSVQLFTCGSSPADFPSYVPMIRGLFGPQIAKMGTQALFAVIVNNEFSAGFTVTFDWGDDTKSEPQAINAKASHAVTATHAYIRPGRYDVVVSVVNPSGKKNTSAVTVTVE